MICTCKLTFRAFSIPSSEQTSRTNTFYRVQHIHMNLSLMQAMFRRYADANQHQHQFLQGLAFYWNSKVKAEIFEGSSMRHQTA